MGFTSCKSSSWINIRPYKNGNLEVSKENEAVKENDVGKNRDIDIKWKDLNKKRKGMYKKKKTDIKLVLIKRHCKKKISSSNTLYYSLMNRING